MAEPTEDVKSSSDLAATESGAPADTADDTGAAVELAATDKRKSDSEDRTEASPLKSEAGARKPLSRKKRRDDEPARDPTQPPPELEGTERYQWLVRHNVVYHKFFEPFILFVIIVNCVFLALDNPARSGKRLEKTVDASEYVFLVIYLVEMAFKMFAFNLFGTYEEPGEEDNSKQREKRAAVDYMMNSVFKPQQEEEQKKDTSYVGYFLDGWNILDFVVIIVGSIIPVILNSSSVTAIRALRILRAVRTIPRVTKLRILVRTLLDSLVHLGVSLVLLTFFFVVFGIIGVDFFSGKLQDHCYVPGDTSKDGLLTYFVGDTEYYSICSNNKQCRAIDSSGTYTCQDGDRNPNANMQHFDNIFYSLLMVFQTVTLQDWSKVLYDLHFRTGYISWLWFVSLIFFVSFFALNLLLAVIAVTYSHSRLEVQVEEDFSNNIDEVDVLIAMKERSGSKKPMQMAITYDNYDRYIRVLKQKVAMFEELFQEFSQSPVEAVKRTHELQKKDKIQGTLHDVEKEHLGAMDDDEFAQSQYDLGLEDDDPDSWEYSKRALEQKDRRSKMISETMQSFNSELARAVWALAKPIPDEYLEGKGEFVMWCNKVATSETFEKVMLFIIFCNTIVLGIWWPTMSKPLTQTLAVLNYIFTGIFILELGLKLVGLGVSKWSYDKFNVFDGIIVLVSIIDIIVAQSTNAGGVGGAILAFRALRVLRVLRLMHQVRSLRILLNSIIESFEPVFFLFTIMSLFLFMFGVIGVQMFAGKVIKNRRDSDYKDYYMFTRPWRFDTLWFSIVTSVQMFSGDGWPSVMGDMVDATTPAAAFIPIIAVSIGLYIFKNMFLAILINRMGSQDDIQFLIDDLIREARRLQVAYKDNEDKGVRECVALVDRFRRARMAAKAGNKHQRRIRKMEQRKRIIGTSLLCFRPDNEFRVWLHQKVVTQDWFEYLIQTLIVTNCVFLALKNPHVKKTSKLGVTLAVLDYIFTTVFIIELIIKVICFGLYESTKQPAGGQRASDAEALKAHQRKSDLGADEPEMSADRAAEEPCRNAYLKSWWNRLDAFVVLVAIFGLIFPSAAVLRGLRAIRPIRIAIRIQQVRVVVKALNASILNIGNGLLFAFFMMFVLSIIGVRIFGGRLHRCVVRGNAYALSDVKDKDACQADEDSEWINAGFHFDNVFAGMLTVFKISTFSNWFEDLAVGMAAVGDHKADRQANPYNSPAAAMYYLLVVLVGGFFLWNILISVVVDSFNRIKREEESNALLTKTQAMWVRKTRFLSRFPLKAVLHKPRTVRDKDRGRIYCFGLAKASHPLRTWCFGLVTDPRFEFVIVGLILVNTVLLMTQFNGQGDMWTDILFGFEIFFVACYAIEACLKLLGLGYFQYFNDWWNVFDFVIVIMSLVGFASDAKGAAVFRLLRVSRLVRLIKRAPALRAQFLTLVYAIPSLMNIGFLLFVIFFIWGIFGVELFGKVYHNDGYGNPLETNGNDGISRSVNFEYFSRSLLILYRVATNDNWGSIMLAAGAQGTLCNGEKAGEQEGDFTYKCGNMGLAIVYFVSFGICGTLVMVNLFIAVILDTYHDNITFERNMDRLMETNGKFELGPAEEWIETWKKIDKDQHKGRIRGRLPVKEFIRTLKQSPRLIGLMLEALTLRLSVDMVGGADRAIDYNDEEQHPEIERRSTDVYGKIEFVGSANILDAKVKVTNDHINAIVNTRRLRILCSLIHQKSVQEKLVVYYSDALFAIASLVVGPEFRLLPFDEDKYTHISDWWDEQLEEARPTF